MGITFKNVGLGGMRKFGNRCIAHGTDYKGGELVCTKQNGDQIDVAYKNEGDVGMFTGDIIHRVNALEKLEGKDVNRELLILRLHFPHNFGYVARHDEQLDDEK